MNQQEIIAIMALEGKPVITYRGRLVYPNNLNFVGTEIQHLPDGLVVAGDLNTNKSLVKTLPDRLLVLGHLAIGFSIIDNIPDNLMVCGDFYIGKKQLTKFPKNLFVGGSMLVIDSPSIPIPDDATICGPVHFNDGFTDRTTIQRLQIIEIQNKVDDYRFEYQELLTPDLQERYFNERMGRQTQMNWRFKP